MSCATTASRTWRTQSRSRFCSFLKIGRRVDEAAVKWPAIVPKKYGWDAPLKLEGDELEVHYRHCLEELGKQSGMLGEIFKKAGMDVRDPATLRRLIVDLIEPVKWSSMDADVKGDIYEGLLAKSAEESPRRGPGSISRRGS